MLLARGALNSAVFSKLWKCSVAPAVNLLHTTTLDLGKAKNKGGKKKVCGPDKVAVVIAGCGCLDGTEISECMATVMHLSRKGLEPCFFAPNIDICGTVNHLTKEPEECGPPRNALIEGARLARCKIRPLSECSSCAMKGLVLPGGFGVARTMSDFAAKGCNCVVLPDIDRIIKEFVCDCKPIATMCISPVLVARVLQGVKITLGKDSPCERWPYADAINVVKQMGAEVELKDVRSFSHCKQFNVFSTPAWMDSCATYADINEGIGKMIEAYVKTVNRC